MFIKLVRTCPLETRCKSNKRNVTLTCQNLNTFHQHFSYTAVLKFRQNGKSVHFNVSAWLINRYSFNDGNKTDNIALHVGNKCAVAAIAFHLLTSLGNRFIRY